MRLLCCPLRFWPRPVSVVSSQPSPGRQAALVTCTFSPSGAQSNSAMPRQACRDGMPASGRPPASLPWVPGAQVSLPAGCGRRCAPDCTAVPQPRADRPGADSAEVSQRPWPFCLCMRRPGCLLALRRSAVLLACLPGCRGWHARHWPVHLVRNAGGHPIN